MLAGLVLFFIRPGARNSAAATVVHPWRVGGLKCESAVNPLDVDVAHPRLSWVVTSDEEGQRQTAYQILVASTPRALAKDHGDLWDSGKISASETIEVPYAGQTLQSAEHVYWKVRAWDMAGKPSRWSTMCDWTMGLLNASDWTAKWIGAPQGGKKSVTDLFRKEFRITKPLKRALCFVSGLGQYEMWLNGRKVGKDWITPGWTQYAKTCLADSYDVTSLLSVGPNAAAIHVGNGMYSMGGDTRGGQQTNTLGPRMTICQLRLDYRDGSTESIGTDPTWSWSPSPETYSGVFGGEDWDARLEQSGWTGVGFDEKGWLPASLPPAPTGVLRGLTHAAPPLRVIETRVPIARREPKPNILVLDLGQNSPYVPQIKVQGAAGTTVKLSPAEIINPDGTINQTTMRPGKYASYTLRGGAAETWHPSFWYVGSRYWEIQATDVNGHPIDPKNVLRDFEGLLVHGDIAPVGHFACSNELFNQIHSLIWWAICSNFASVVTDCPHREKSGWLEQIHLMGGGLMYTFDMSTMFRKMVQDMTDTQLANGMVPTMAPEYFIYDGGFRDSVEWGGAYLLLPEMMQGWYGKQGLVAEHYQSMKRYVDYLGTQAHANILSNGLGDWNGGGTDSRTPAAVTDTAYYFDMAHTLAKFARSIGNASDASRYEMLSQAIKISFDDKFLDRSTGKVATGSQSCQATALDLGLIDPADEGKVFAQLMADIEAHAYAVSCGEVGHPAMLRSLTKFGRSDVVAKIHLQTDKPGYGYQIKKGLTTLAETWDAALDSYNHFMLGHLMEWLYADLLGIQPDPNGLAFSKSIIKPRPVGGVTWAKGSYDSVRGRIECSWKKDGDKFHMDVTIPANTTATVYMPAKPGSTVQITGRLKLTLIEKNLGGYEPVEIRSGHYALESSL